MALHGTNKCDYCDSEYDRIASALNDLFGIKACDEHFPKAEHDVKVWFHRNKQVPVERVLERFNLTKNGIAVLRTDGSITEGGWITESTRDMMRLVIHNEKEGWMINVSFNTPAGVASKYIKLQCL